MEGWPYETMLELLDSQPTESIAAGILNELGTFYDERANRGDQREIPYSLISVERARTNLNPSH
jgi:hypothetical protein